MITIEIPGFRRFQLKYLVLDYNGTLAVDGKILPGVARSLNHLAASLDVFVVTADTFGKARRELDGVPCHLEVLSRDEQIAQKKNFVERLGAKHTVSIGNGRNDAGMLKAAALGIGIVMEEGIAVETLLAADILCPHILHALNLLENPMRLVATLRR